MQGHGNTFQKKERLCRKKIINQLTQGEEVNKIAEYPFLLVYKITILPEKIPAQVAFGVGRKSFRKAVERNYIRRQMRELYRTNKQLIYPSLLEKNKQVAMLIIYTAAGKTEFSQMKKSFTRLIEKFNQHIV